MIIFCPNCGCNPQDEPYCMVATHCPKCGYIFKNEMDKTNMNRDEMKEKIRLYVTDSVQKLEIFTDIEICSSKDNENAHEIMDNRLNAMTDVELENMCNRINFEDNYDSYCEIIG